MCPGCSTSFDGDPGKCVRDGCATCCYCHRELIGESPPMELAQLTPAYFAAESSRVNTANGFEPVNWDNWPIKAMLVITELNEAVDATRPTGDDNLEEELADVAIRLLSAMYDLNPRWTDGRVRKRSYVGRIARPFERPEVLMWPILDYVCQSVEAWRHVSDPAVDRESADDVVIGLEFAILETFRLADRLRFDLLEAIRLMVEKNAKRERLHGKARST